MPNVNFTEFKAKAWYHRRYTLLIFIFIGFGSCFFYDGYIGYPKKNLIYKEYNKIQELHNIFSKHQFDNNNLSEQGKVRNWENEVVKKKMDDFFKNPANLINKTVNQIWTEYTKIKKWSDKIPKEYSDLKIKEQFAFGFLCSLIGFIIMIYFIFNFRKTLGYSNDSIKSLSNDIIPFKNIYKVDKVKWQNKGLAYIYYKNDKKTNNKITLDCLRFGEESEIVLDKLLEKFSGELVDIEQSNE